MTSTMLKNKYSATIQMTEEGSSEGKGKKTNRIAQIKSNHVYSEKGKTL